MNQTEEATGATAVLLEAFRRLSVFDVSQTIDNDLPVWFMYDSPSVIPVIRHNVAGAAVNNLTLCEHTGSHVDAPFHFDADGQAMAAVPVDQLLLRPYCKYDLTADDHQPGDLVGLEHLKAAEARAGFQPEPGDVAILEFGWDRYLPGGEDAKQPSWWGRNQPGLSDEACEYLADLQVAAVACDTAACDVAAVDGEMSGAHGHVSAFLPRGILIVEGLNGLANVPVKGLFVALPLKIADGTGSPVRVVLLAD